MSSQNDAKNIYEEEKCFKTTIKKYLSDIESTLSKNHKCEILIKLFTFMNTMTFWINSLKYIAFKRGVISKCYNLLSQLEIEKKYVDEKILQESHNVMHETLRLCCCNKIRRGLYCKNKKNDEYCTFHTNIKNKILNCVAKSTEPYIIKDLFNIIGDYISL